MKYRFILIFILFLITFETALSRDYVRIHDTTITRGGVHYIEVYSNLNFLQIESIDLLLSFNANVIDIKRVIGGGNYLLQDETKEVELNLSNLENSTARIFSDNLLQSSTGVLFALEVEGLVYSDSITLVTPIRFLLSGNEVKEVNFMAGRITVSGVQLIDSEAEWLGNAYPNPFTYWTDLKFRISKESKVDFDIFDYSGRRIVSYPKNDTDELIFYIYDENNAQINEPKNHIYSEGEYRIQIHPQGLYLKPGPFYLLMRTAQNVYQSNFFYIK